MGMKTLSWEWVYERLKDAPKGKLYGVPRGGAIVAGLTGRVVATPGEADVIVDDIVDSGATRDRYVKQYGKKFWALYEKKPGDGWVVFPWEHEDPTRDNADIVIRLLEFIGEQPSRDGLRDTPRRYLSAFKELTEGYGQDPKEILKRTFKAEYDEMVVVKDIPFSSLCEHHLFPFTGTCTIAYIPAGDIVGLSKLPRLVQCFARRLQVQEQLTQQIAHAVDDHLHPVGVGVLVKGHHTCMSMRGVKTSGEMVTSCLLGAMKTKPEARAEFLSLVVGGGNGRS